MPGKSCGRRSLVGCSPWGREELDMTERLPFHFSLSCIGEGNDNPLQCSCLENPRDGEIWWASIYGVAQSRTRLKQLSSSSSSRLRLKALATLIFYYCTVIFGRKEVKLKHHRYVTMCLYIIRISPLILEDGFLTEQFSSIHRRVLKMGFT